MTIEEMIGELIAKLGLANHPDQQHIRAFARDVEREALEKVRDIVLLELIPGANLGIAIAEESEGPSQAGRWIDALQVAFRERIRALMPPDEQARG